MTNVTLAEARSQLEDLIKAAQRGEEVVISDDDRPAVKLVPIVQTERRPKFGSAKGKIIMADDFDESQPAPDRRPGSAKGKIVIAEDFDEPLEDFKDYMP